MGGIKHNSFYLGGEISPFTGATSSANGSKGLVPAPAVADKDKFLKGDGTWGSAEAPAGTPGKITVQTGTCSIFTYVNGNATYYVPYFSFNYNDAHKILRCEFYTTNNVGPASYISKKNILGSNINFTGTANDGKWYFISSSRSGYGGDLIYGDFDVTHLGYGRLSNVVYLTFCGTYDPGKTTYKLYLIE